MMQAREKPRLAVLRKIRLTPFDDCRDQRSKPLERRQLESGYKSSDSRRPKISDRDTNSSIFSGLIWLLS
jgi:hypothetical protein